MRSVQPFYAGLNLAADQERSTPWETVSESGAPICVQDELGQLLRKNA